MRLGFFLKEAIRAMRRNAAPSFAAFATVVVTLIVVGVFIPIVQAAQGEANTVRGRVLVDVYMNTAATPAMEARAKRELLAMPHIARVTFESKTQAYRQQSKQDPAAYALLSTNPLPDTFHVYADSPGNVLGVQAELTHGGKPFDGAVASISNHRQDTKKLLAVTGFVTVAAIVVSILLIIASIALIANTIRLSLFARRREVEVMKLVGATDWFIRWPFMIEGVIVGAAGAVAAITVLGIAKIAFLDPLAANWGLIGSLPTLPFAALVAVLVAAGVSVSAVGSGLSLRRFLRV